MKSVLVESVGKYVTIGPFIWLYLWVIVSRVNGLLLWSAVGGCRCQGNRVSLQVRATTVAGQVVTRGEFVSLSRVRNESGTVYRVCCWNFRNCELFLVCSTCIYDSM